jgi:hypothetical protein
LTSCGASSQQQDPDFNSIADADVDEWRFFDGNLRRNTIEIILTCV